MRQRLLGKSVIDFVNGDINRLRARLAPAEQQKLDQHLSALSDLEKQLTSGTTATGPMCSAPSKPDASLFPKLKRYNGGEPYFDAIANAQIDLIAQAFACDITRFATLLLNDGPYDGGTLSASEDIHGQVAHTYNPSPVGNDG